jgi:hypothetical protein
MLFAPSDGPSWQGATTAFAAMHSSDFGGAVTPYVANALRTAASGGT